MNKPRLQKLIAFLEKLPEDQFDLKTIRDPLSNCGTIACAVGWCPNIFDEVYVKWRDDPQRVSIVFPNGQNFYGAQSFFGLDRATAHAIFTPEAWSIKPTRKNVVGRLKRLVDNCLNSRDKKDIFNTTREFVPGW